MVTSEGSNFWPEYFDGIGSGHVERIGDVYRPLTFAAFCLRYASDHAFLMFYRQLHVFIHTIAIHRDESRLEKVRAALEELLRLLEQRKGLLAGLTKEEIGLP